MTHLSNIFKKPYFLFATGLALGMLVLLSARFLTYSPDHRHYHANFAIFINGTREEFKGQQFYEAVNICSTDGGITIPQQRAHMHSNINTAVHVHDHAVTWGQFFANLGWTITGDIIQTDDGTVYRADDTNKVNILIDGQDYTGLESISNRLIKDEERLLLSFGPSGQPTLDAQYKSVAKSAGKFNLSKDPSSCSSQESPSAKQRMQHMF